jgi:hypothetical protein
MYVYRCDNDNNSSRTHVSGEKVRFEMFPVVGSDDATAHL